MKVLESNKILASEYLLSFNTNVRKQLTEIDEALPKKVVDTVYLPIELKEKIDSNNQKSS